EVYRRPGSQFVAEFLGETNLLQGLPLATASGPARESALLSVRPEAWRLGAKPEPVNSFPGRIVETVYLGEMARHRFAMDAGKEIVIFELNPRPRAAGELLHAAVDPADVVEL